MIDARSSLDWLDDLQAMRAEALPFLARDEANNTIALNALALACSAPQNAVALRMLVLREGGEIAAVALVRSGRVFLACNRAAHARLIGQHLKGDSELCGVVGEATAVSACVQAIGRAAYRHMGLRLHALVSIPQPGVASGSMRVAGADDFDLLVVWQRAFEAEARSMSAAVPLEDLVARRIEQGLGYVWCDAQGTVVCHAAAVRIPPSSARIAPVYTPVRCRTRGYAQALVASVSSALLERGVHNIFLFTDIDNPTSNAVYARVGFRALSEHTHFEFDRK